MFENFHSKLAEGKSIPNPVCHHLHGCLPSPRFFPLAWGATMTFQLLSLLLPFLAPQYILNRETRGILLKQKSTPATIPLRTLQAPRVLRPPSSCVGWVPYLSDFMSRHWAHRAPLQPHWPPCCFSNTPASLQACS